MMTDDAKTFREWCVLELMGHRRLAGLVSEEVIAGKAFVRLDVPADEDGQPITQFYGAEAVYCITPTTEEIAREVSRETSPAPISRFRLAQRELEFAAPDHEAGMLKDHEDVDDDDPEAQRRMRMATQS